MSKITLKEFLNLPYKAVIHCRTAEQVKILSEEWRKIRDSRLDFIESFTRYGDKVAFSNRDTWGNIDRNGIYCLEYGTTVFEFDNVSISIDSYVNENNLAWTFDLSNGLKDRYEELPF